MRGLAGVVLWALQSLADWASLLFDYIVRVFGPWGRLFGSGIHAWPLRYLALALLPIAIGVVALFPRSTALFLSDQAGMGFLNDYSPADIAQGAVVAGILFVALLVLNAIHIRRWIRARETALDKLGDSTVAEVVSGSNVPPTLDDEVVYVSIFLTVLFLLLFSVLLDTDWSGYWPITWNWLSLRLLGYCFISSLPVVGLFVDETSLAIPKISELGPTVGMWVRTLQLFAQFVVFAFAVSLFKSILSFTQQDDGSLVALRGDAGSQELSPRQVLDDLKRYDRGLGERLADSGLAGAIAQGHQQLQAYRDSADRDSIRGGIVDLLNRIEASSDSGGLGFAVEALELSDANHEIVDAASRALGAIKKREAVGPLSNALARERSLPSKNRWHVRVTIATALGRFKTEAAALSSLLTLIGPHGDRVAYVRREALWSMRMFDLARTRENEELREKLQSALKHACENDKSPRARDIAGALLQHYGWT